jgi:hypothetical protein
LIRPKDATEHWEPVRLHHEVTTHRMQWVKTGPGKTDVQLVVVPLHGLGNKDGKGAGVRILAYDVPKDPHGEWKTHLLNDSMHMTHNFELWWNQHMETEHIFVAGLEGIGGGTLGQFGERTAEARARLMVSKREMPRGAGEVRFCYATPPVFGLASIEPMHGNEVVFYAAKQEVTSDPFDAKSSESHWLRHVVDDTLAEGHALGCADFLGVWPDGKYRHQIVAGWRAPNKDKKVGIKLYVPLDDKGEKWQTHVIDDNLMACEDLKIADLDGDGQPDIIASGRATHNLVIYWNRTRGK